jgi:hypothetical protein
MRVKEMHTHMLSCLLQNPPCLKCGTHVRLPHFLEHKLQAVFCHQCCLMSNRPMRSDGPDTVFEAAAAAPPCAITFPCRESGIVRWAFMSIDLSIPSLSCVCGRLQCLEPTGLPKRKNRCTGSDVNRHHLPSMCVL